MLFSIFAAESAFSSPFVAPLHLLVYAHELWLDTELQTTHANKVLVDLGEALLVLVHEELGKNSSCSDTISRALCSSLAA